MRLPPQSAALVAKDGRIFCVSADPPPSLLVQLRSPSGASRVAARCSRSHRCAGSLRHGRVTLRMRSGRRQ